MKLARIMGQRREAGERLEAGGERLEVGRRRNDAGCTAI
jgi:hypothetical protein